MSLPARVLAWLLCSALALPAHAAAPSVAPARAELDAGLAAYDRGEFAVAAEHFERAYELEPSPQSLYAWAQATRSAGDCKTAVELYRRFLDAGATGDSRTAAEQNEARCQEQLERTAVPEPTPTLTPAPVPEPEPVAAPEPARTPPRRRDAAAIALLSAGAVAAAAGAVVLGFAGAAHREQSRTRDYDRFDALDPRIDRLYIAGGIVLGVGAVLLAVGGARLANARRRARTVSLAPSWSPNGGAMLSVRIAPRRRG